MDLPLICFIYSIFNNCFVNSKRKETKNRIMKYWNKDFFFVKQDVQEQSQVLVDLV